MDGYVVLQLALNIVFLKRTTMNYTKEQAVLMCGVYIADPSRATVEHLAKQLDKSIKSIIGKLSKEGVYRREVYKTKLGDDPITKIEIVENIAEILELEGERLLGLDKTPKIVLKLLEQKLIELL